MGRHAYTATQGARYSKHLGVRYSANQATANVTWYTDAHEKLYEKGKYKSAIYYHVTSADGTLQGWIWRGYLKAGSGSATTTTTTTPTTTSTSSSRTTPLAFPTKDGDTYRWFGGKLAQAVSDQLTHDGYHTSRNLAEVEQSINLYFDDWSGTMTSQTITRESWDEFDLITGKLQPSDVHFAFSGKGGTLGSSDLKDANQPTKSDWTTDELARNTGAALDQQQRTTGTLVPRLARYFESILDKHHASYFNLDLDYNNPTHTANHDALNFDFLYTAVPDGPHADN